MAPVLTLIHGDAEQPFIEHPITTVREACLAAANQLKHGTDAERRWAKIFKRFAKALSNGYAWEMSQASFRRRPTVEDRDARDRAQRRDWHRLTDAAREEVILTVLGDEVLTGKDLAARISETTDYVAYADELRTMLRKISYLGGIAHHKVPRIEGGTAWKWVYSRARKGGE